jgi:hypothetical protein
VARTKVLFAFGMHEFVFPSRKRFFRGSVVPFVEENARNGRVAIIHEMGYTEAFFTNRISDEDKIRACNLAREQRGQNDTQLAEVFGKAEQMVNQGLLDACEQGLPIRTVLPDWGFWKDIVRIHRERPGAIKNLVEPVPDLDAVYGYWRSQSLAGGHGDRSLALEERLRCMEGFIVETARMVLHRDNAVLGLVARLSKEEPGISIVIPRGMQHNGMAQRLDPCFFEVTIKEDSWVGTTFSHEYISMLYEGRVDAKALRRLAKSEIVLNDIFGPKFLFAHIPTFMRSGLRGLIDLAKEKAIAQVDSE